MIRQRQAATLRQIDVLIDRIRRHGMLAQGSANYREALEHLQIVVGLALDAPDLLSMPAEARELETMFRSSSWRPEL